jgi:hypothetical protein
MPTAPEFVLPDFDGMPTVAAGIEVRNISGGLNEAMAIEPRLLHRGDVVYVLAECKVADINHKAVDKDDPASPWRRIAVMSASAATVLDPQDAKPAVDAQRQRILKAKEEAAGIQRIAEADQAAEKDAERRKTKAASNGADDGGFLDTELLHRHLMGHSRTELRQLCDDNDIKWAETNSRTQLADKLIKAVPDLAEKLPPIEQEK